MDSFQPEPCDKPLANARGSVTPIPSRDGKGAVVSDDEPMLFCPVCSRRLAERKCKLFCEQCGYFMSCADYY